MTRSIDTMKLRINTLESVLRKQEDAFVSGYVTALKDNGLLLVDVSIEDLNELYRAELYSKYL